MCKNLHKIYPTTGFVTLSKFDEATPHRTQVTGEPTCWPRQISDELEIATRFEYIFRESFQADRRSTLAVICFALGTWVGGMYTAACCRWLASKGYQIAVITSGNNKTEILRVVQALGGSSSK